MIAHIDADSFFASVLQRLHPRLRGKPLFALGMHGTFIIAASYEAKAKGVKTGMPIKEARKLCPDAVEMASNFRDTGLASEQIEGLLKTACPIIEQMSIDEWYLDLKSCVGGVPKDLTKWARDLQTFILNHTAISVSIGVAQSKILSKLAGEMHKPAGVTVVHPQDLEKFLKMRPLEAICGMGRRRTIPAHARGWKMAWDMACAPDELLRQLYGRPGINLKQELLGNPIDPVSDSVEPPKSISRCRSFKATRDPHIIWSHLLQHLSRVVLRLRRWELGATHVSVWLRDNKFAGNGTSLRLALPCDEEGGFLEPMRRAIREIYEPGKAYTQAGLAIFGLVPMHAKQQSLFEMPGQSTEDASLQKALDTVRDRFGRDIVHRAAAMPTASNERPEFGLTTMEM